MKKPKKPRCRMGKDARLVGIGRIVGELQKCGQGGYRSLCPFHKEQTPSFLINKTVESYHCLGCGKSGRVDDLIAMGGLPQAKKTDLPILKRLVGV